MGYFKDALKGFSWLVGFRGFSRLMTFIRTAILARILLPAQFGVYGIAIMVLAFLEVATETGINIFLIQKEEKVDEYLNTAWIISIFRGTLIALLIILFAPWIAAFFNSPESKSLLYLASLAAFIRGFINPSQIKFQKQLQFNKDFWFRSSILLLETIAVISLTVINRSAISLIWGLIIGSLLEVIFSFIFIHPRPKPTFKFSQLKLIVKQGKWITFAGIFNYLASQGDDAVVAKLLNTGSLGLYQMAFKLSTLPISEIGDVAGKVTFPIYVKIANDQSRLKKAYLRTLLTITSLALPLAMVLFFFPRQIISLVLGQNWLQAAPALKILSIYGFISAIVNSGYTLFLSLKKQQLITFATFIRLLTLAVVIIPLVLKQGIIGAAQACLLSIIVTMPVVLFQVIKVFKS
ncbi:lipopolysaccharide biosynthesis protein [Patescibacteria group bacterium]